MVEKKFKNLQDKLEKLQTYDWSIFFFFFIFSMIALFYLIFQPLYYTLRLSSTGNIV